MGEIMRLTEVETISLIVDLKPGESPLVITEYHQPWPGYTWDEMAQALTAPMQAPQGYYAYGTPTDPNLKPKWSDGELGYYETDESRILADTADQVEAARIVMAHIYEETW